MKRYLPILLLLTGFYVRSETGYEIKISIKNLPDTATYLAKWTFGKSYVVDTCKKVVKGNMVFKGKRDLDKGSYFIAGVDKEGKAIHRFDFVVDDSFKFSITSDFADLQNNLKCVGSKENEDFFAYTRFYTNKNKEFGALIPD